MNASHGKPVLPPPSLTRPADEAALRVVEQEIDRWLFAYVQRWRCVDPVACAGVALDPMKDEEVRAFVAANFRELWEVLPERLKQEYVEAQARLDAQPMIRTPAETVGASAKRKTGRPRKGESDKERLVIGALATHHKCHGRSVGNDIPAKTRHLAELASGKQVKVSVATVSRFFQRKFPGRGYKGYEAACVRGEIAMLLASWQGDVSEHLVDLLPHESGRVDDN